MSRNLIRLLRAKHWIKNGLIFFPLLFSLELSLSNASVGLIGFTIFCIASSIVYILNDLKDLENDRKHPTKKLRPIASGEVSVNSAHLLVAILTVILLCLLGASGISVYAVSIVLLYIAINLAYSFGLKHVPILDIFILATGFVLRVIFGALIFGIAISNWLLLTVLCASLFMGIGKRRNELLQTKKITRPVNKHYTLNFLNNNLYTFMALIICFYALWSIDTESNQIQNTIYTVPLVALILMTYSLKLDDKDCDGDPVNVLVDNKPLLALSGLYALTLTILILTRDFVA